MKNHILNFKKLVLKL
ncbi:unnamed protein product [Larinioides sclopetarius]|uniref:Uncharacterized protein n=1 Tax=Larinioides sclopetarius TaxID=280406 RepID=A0AAV2BTN3_9ARAC